MVNNNRREQMLPRIHLALAYIDQLNRKIQSGEYPTELTKCFCGADEDLLLVEADRWGIDHKIVLCQECALMRANPRMTAEGYKGFYNNEYRYINFSKTYSREDKESDFAGGYDFGKARGMHFQETLENFDIELPKVVVDYGCYVGGMLEPFKAAGAETWGIEIDEGSAEYARSRGHNVVSSIEELIKQGVKADLVIMQDVIEHLLDLHDVQKVGEILKPLGHLYVWTPGIFRHKLDWYFQIAHTYQFCARSLEYVMGELGFDEVYIDEEISSFWHYVGPEHSLKMLKKPSEWAEYISDHVFQKEQRKMPRFRGVCKFPQKLLYQNVEENLSEKAPDLFELTGTKSGDLMILGGGPSVNDQIEKIRELKEQGLSLMVISRMYPWCAKHGIKPDYVVSLDCSEEQEKSFTDLQPDVTYILASVTRPSIFKQLRGEKRYVFDSKESLKHHRLREENGYEVATVINGGGSVTITCLSLGMNLGFRRFHVFGLDLLVTDRDKTHADGIAGASLPLNLMEVEIAGETIITTSSFLDFANQTLDMVSLGHEDGILESVKFYGESLLNKLWDGVFHTESENVQVS